MHSVKPSHGLASPNGTATKDARAGNASNSTIGRSKTSHSVSENAGRTSCPPGRIASRRLGSGHGSLANYQTGSRSQVAQDLREEPFGTAAARPANMRTNIYVPFLLSFLLPLLAAGCAHILPRQLLPTPSAAGLDLRTLTNPGLRRFMEHQLREPMVEWPLLQWDFPKLTLAAYYFNPRLDAARCQWQQAEAALAAEGGRPPATGPDEFSFSEAKGYVPFAIITPEPNAARPHGEPFLPARANGESLASHSGKRAQRIAKAGHRTESARRHLQAVAWHVRASVRTNLIACVAARRAETLLEDLEATYVNLVESVKSRSATGLMPALDLSLLELHLAQTRLGLIQTKLEKMDARARLADSLALPVSVLFNVEIEFDFSRIPPLGVTTHALRWQALHSRPDVLTALADYTSAEMALRNELNTRHPRASFPPGCSWDEQKVRWKLNTEPILSVLQRSSRNATRAEASRLAAAARLLNLQVGIMDELERGETIYRVTAGEAGDIHARVAVLVRQYAMLDDQIQTGAAGPTELWLARSQLMAAGMAKLEAQVKLQNALGLLEDALHLPVELIGRASPF